MRNEKKKCVLFSLILFLNYFLVCDDRDGKLRVKEPFSREVKNTWGGKQMKKNIMRPILCFLIATAFLIPLMGTTTLAEDTSIYFFDSRVTSGDPAPEWEENQDLMIDGDKDNYASTTLNGDVQELDGNTCPTGVIPVTKVELKTRGYYNQLLNARYIILRIHGSEFSYIFDNISSTAQWSGWFDITEDLKSHLGESTLTFTHVHNLDIDVLAGVDMNSFELFCSIVKIQVTY